MYDQLSDYSVETGREKRTGDVKNMDSLNLPSPSAFNNPALEEAWSIF
jgi:hypothetical protein